jgi:hypothetical protein
MVQSAAKKTIGRSVERPVPVRAPAFSAPRLSSLKVSSPSDPAEKEAEATARKILRMPEPARGPAPRFTSPYIARFAAVPIGRCSPRLARKDEGQPDASANINAQIAASQASGGPLPHGVRRFMEPRFRADFGHVRIHTGNQAARLSSALGARAFTVGDQVFFGKDRFKPETEEGRELIAHELTHTMQQAPVAQRCPEIIVTQHSSVHVQRSILSRGLDMVAERVNDIPGFRMFTIVLGVNPVNMRAVDRSPANILRAVIEFIPGGGLLRRALDNYGIIEKAATWIGQQIRTLGLVGGAIRSALVSFIEDLDLGAILSPGATWNRLKRIFTEPIDRILEFVKNLANGLLELIKEAVLRPLAGLAQQTSGYDLLKAVLQKDPITGDPYPRTAETVIGGFMKLANQGAVWATMQEARAVPRAWAWFQNALNALMGFVREIPSLFLKALKSLEIADLVLLPRAFLKVGSVFGSFLGRFITWAGTAVWNLLEIIFDVVSPGALGYVKKTGAALKSILRNPIPFVGNLVKAAKLGFTSFAGRFLQHLKAGLIDWLTGSLPGVYIPKAFTLPEVAKFVFSVLGLTWANIRAKLVKAVGETAVKAMEVGFDIVVTLVTQGPAAAWDKIKEQLANLKDMVINGITDLVVDAVVKKAVPKLIAMFIPGAGFISAILTIYDTVMVFVQKISKIIQVVTSFVNSIVAIAAGQVGAAAARVESTLAGLLSLAISFLAGFAGLGNVATKVMGVIQKIRAPIDKALDWLVNWIVTMAKKLGRFIAQTGVPQDPMERLRLAVGAATSAAKALGKGFTRPLLEPVLSGLVVRYGLRQMQAFERAGSWWVKASINPDLERNMGIIVVVQPSAAGPSGLTAMKEVPITFKCNLKKFILTVFQEQLKGQEAGLNAISVPDWIKNRANFRDGGRGSSVPQAELRALYRKELGKRQLSEEQIEDEMERLAALHEPDLVAGGFNMVAKLGSLYINSSIGSQWRTKVGLIEDEVGLIPDADKPNRRINVKLTAEGHSP